MAELGSKLSAELLFPLYPRVTTSKLGLLIMLIIPVELARFRLAQDAQSLFLIASFNAGV